MEDLAWLCGRLTVFAGGRDVQSGTAGEVFAQVADLRNWGLELPLAARVAKILRERGWPLPDGLARPSGLAQALKEMS
jgi:hypothetical protein